MWGHSDAVYDVVALSDSSLCSCGADNLAILWKDGREQTEIRNQVATVSMMQYLLLAHNYEEETFWSDLDLHLSPERRKFSHSHSFHASTNRELFHSEEEYYNKLDRCGSSDGLPTRHRSVKNSPSVRRSKRRSQSLRMSQERVRSALNDHSPYRASSAYSTKSAAKERHSGLQVGEKPGSKEKSRSCSLLYRGLPNLETEASDAFHMATFMEEHSSPVLGNITERPPPPPPAAVGPTQKRDRVIRQGGGADDNEARPKEKKVHTQKCLSFACMNSLFSFSRFTYLCYVDGSHAAGGR